MNDRTPQIDTERLRELAKLRVVLSVPGMQDVIVERDIPYAEDAGEVSGMDVYLPPRVGSASPAVIFIAGYRDTIGRQLLGFGMKEMGAYVSWGQLVAASGMAGIAYASADPPKDARAILEFVRQHAARFHIDPERIGIWSASGNGPTALSLLTEPDTKLRFAVMSNTYMLDLDGDSTVADKSREFGFAAPNSQKSVSDLDPDVPMFLVRSGRDQIPGLNGTIDRFVAAAIEANRSIRFANIPDAPHSFDTLHDTDESREVIRQIIEFMLASSAE